MPARSALVGRLALLMAMTVPDAGAASQGPSRSGVPGELVAIRTVTVVDVTDGSLRPGRTVLVEGRRITAIGPAATLRIDDGFTVVDGEGGYLIPGLWDMHAHAFGSQRGFAPLLQVLIANGVTGIRDPQHSSLELAAMVEPAIRAGEMPGPPRLVVAGNMVDGFAASWPGAQVADSPERGGALVGLAGRRGSPLHQGVQPSGSSDVSRHRHARRGSRDPLRRPRSDARERGVRFSGGAAIVRARALGGDGLQLREQGGPRGVERVVELLRRSGLRGSGRRRPQPTPDGEHPIAFHEARCRELLDELARNRTWQTPTLAPAWALSNATDSALAADPRTRYVPRDGVLSYWEHNLAGMPPKNVATRMLERQRRVTGMLEDHGVPLLVGTDMPAAPMVYPGFGVHDEMKLLVGAGLSALYVLQAATLNPAPFLQMDDSLGTVEVGKLADLVLLEGNPLEDIGNVERIRAVVANGRLYDRRRLDGLLADVAAESDRTSAATLVSEALKEGGDAGRALAAAVGPRSPPRRSSRYAPRARQEARMASKGSSKIYPHFWYAEEAEEAARFYASIFPDSRVDRVTPLRSESPSGPPGSVTIVDFTLFGQRFQAMSAGPHHEFNDAISMVVSCDDQAELDRYWNALLEGGGKEQACGWITDRFGVRWQIVPAVLDAMMQDDDPARSKRVTDALLEMVRIDIATLEEAYRS